MPKVLVIGGGVSGLAAATFLVHAGLDVEVLEAAPQPGGNVRSERVDGRVLDRAANGWLDSEPAMDRLLALAGLDQRLVPASAASKVRWIYAKGRMHPAPLSPPALLASRLLSPLEKLRMAWEPFVPPGDPSVEESVGAFARRRLGSGAVDKLVAPMVSGIYAGDADQISLPAAFPRMVELEQTYGSLVRAAIARRGGGAPSGHLTTLTGGAGSLPEGLAEHLGERLRCGVQVTCIQALDEAWVVRHAGGDETADAVVLACPAYAQAELVQELDRELAERLAAIPYAPVAVVASAWPEGAWEREPVGFGVLLARGEDLGGVLGCLFTHCVFPDQSRPGELLLRTILGGSLHPEVIELEDQQLIHRARQAHVAFLGPERKAPSLVRVFRHPRGIPQYALGHPARVRAIREAEGRHHGLVLTGNHLEGIGVKDCAKAGERAAQRVVAQLAL